MANNLPSAWTWETLGSLAHFINGYSFAHSDRGDSGLPIIRIEQLKDRQAACDRYSGRLPGDFLLRDGDIVFSWSGSFFVELWDRGPAWLNQHLFRVIPNKSVERKFMFHLLNWSIKSLSQRSHGTTMSHVTRKDLSAHHVLLAPISEQRRIAAILDVIDAEIAALLGSLGRMESLKRGIFRDLMPWALGDPSPIGWALASFEELTAAPICYGIVQAGAYFPNGIPVVMIRDLESNLTGNLHRTRPAIDASYSRSRVHSGDVLLSIKGTIGRVGIVPNGFSGNISRDVARLRVNSRLVPGFLAWLLSTQAGQDILERAVVGTTRAEVSIGILKRLTLPVPILSEQQRILAVVSAIEERISTERRLLQKLGNAKKGLMEDLLTGRVRVSEAEAVLEDL